MADRAQRRAADLANTLGNVVGGGEDLLRLLVQQQMVVAEKDTLNNPSTAWRDMTQYDLGHLQIVAVTSFAETFRDTVAILHLAILAHLPLALEPRDGKAETYNAAQHDLYVGVGRI